MHNYIYIHKLYKTTITHQQLSGETVRKYLEIDGMCLVLRKYHSLSPCTNDTQFSTRWSPSLTFPLSRYLCHIGYAMRCGTSHTDAIQKLAT